MLNNFNSNYITNDNNKKSTINDLENIIFEYHVFKNSYNVNVIYFDKKRNNSDILHINFLEIKNNIKGAFFRAFDINSYKDILLLIESYKNIPPFILIYIGNNPEEILSFSHEKEYFYDILIFKTNKEQKSNKNLFDKYSKIRIIEENNFDIILDYLGKKDYITNQDKKIISNLKPENLITLNQYYEYYNLFHKLLSNYYDNENKIPKLSTTEKNDFLDEIYNLTNLTKEEKDEIKKEINSLNNNDNFIIKIIELYTKQTKLSYSINKLLLSLNPKVYLKIKSYIGKFMYSLYKYAKDNPSKKSNDKILKRALGLKKSDLYLYKACEGDIIILPGFTSTSKNLFIDRLRTYIGNYIYKNKSNILEYVEMIIEFKNNSINNEIICVNISSISSVSYEEEIIFPPFSFFKINKVVFRKGIINEPHLIYVEVINKKYNIESRIKEGKKAYYDNELNCIKTN